MKNIFFAFFFIFILFPGRISYSQKGAGQGSNTATEAKTNTQTPASTNTTAPTTPDGGGVDAADIDAIANKLIPILKTKDDEEKEKKQQNENLKLIRSIPANARDINTAVSNVSSTDKNTSYKVMLKYRAEVFAFHTHFMNNKYLNYNFVSITTFAYDGAELDGKTGNFKTNGWDSASEIDKAQKAGCQVVLTLTDRTQKDISSFLANARSQQKAIDSLKKHISDRKANGVNINFINLPAKDKQKFVDFIALLYKQMHEADSNYQISINIPAFDNAKAYDLSSLQNYVDKFIILNYDYKTKKGSGPGPIAPLGNKFSNSLGTIVDNYIGRGVSPDKFIMCVPYYAIQWGANKSIKYPHYNKIKGQIDNEVSTFNLENDYKSVLIDDKNSTDSVFYDDDQTLGIKYDFILQKQLGGVAIWAMGYDEGYPELSNVLTNKFVTIDTVYNKHGAKDQSSNTKLTGILQDLRNYVSYYYDVFTHPQNYCECEYTLHKKLRVVNIILFIIILILVFLLVYNLKNVGDVWKYKSTFSIAITGLVILFCLTIMMQFFLSSYIPWFGVSSNNGRVKAVIYRNGQYVETSNKIYKDTTICASLKRVYTLSKADSAASYALHKYQYKMVEDTVTLDEEPKVVNYYKKSTNDKKQMGLQFTYDNTSYIIDKAEADKNASPSRPTIPLHVFITIISLGLIIGFVVTRFLFPSIFHKIDIP